MTRRLIPSTLQLVAAASLVAATAISSLAYAQSRNALFIDKRISINVSQSEKNQLLTEMREFLHGFHGISMALARQDMKALAVTARPMGPMLDRMPASLKERLPEEFMQMAIAMNEAFQTLARDAETKNDMSLTHEHLAEVITYCSGCHDTYRFNVVSLKTRQ